MNYEKKYIWFFGIGKTEGGKELSHLLGNKGAQLCEMSKIGIPVPPGFVITTRACIEYMKHGEQFLRKLEPEIKSAVEKLKRYISKIRGKDFPLLLSVRSGAPVSMPGMMDTILNVGMNEEALSYLRGIDERFAYDTRRRFIQMFSSIVLGVDRELFEEEFERWKKAYELVSEGKFHSLEEAYLSVKQNGLGEKPKITDRELTADVMKKVSESFLEIVRSKGLDFPEDPFEQIMLSVEAVFRSWNNERAIAYRRIHNIPDDVGTAANIVTMVFGNMGDDSGTGVLFTRNPNTGERGIWGNFLPNAQGEDVVAGIRTPYALNERSKSPANQNLPTLEELLPDVYKELEKVSQKLEKHYKDMQDVEFTIERRKLWILQTRTGKRSARAHIKIVHDLMQERKISEKEAIKRITPKHISEILFPVIDEARLSEDPIAEGLPASPGAVSGKVVFFPDEAEKLAERGEKVILVRHETSPEDIRGIASALGILTSRGGETSHAAVVARAMGKPAVVGAEAIEIDYENRVFRTNGVEVKEKEEITIDGNTGRVFRGVVPTKTADFPPEMEKLLSVADRIRKLGVRANADTPEEAQIARQFGAEGIGLLRTEHMFFEENRIPMMRKMIIYARKYKEKFDMFSKAVEELAEQNPDHGICQKVKSHIKTMKLFPKFERGSSGGFDELEEMIEQLKDVPTEKSGILELFAEFKATKMEYFSTLKKIKEWIKSDFKEIFEIMEGYPVTVRLLDPPLHEFLPKTEEEIKDTSEKAGIPEEEIKEAIQKLREANPMLGHRGVRVGVTYPEIYCMQTEAILEAVAEIIKQGKRAIPEIMFPNVIDPSEVKFFRSVVESIAEDISKTEGVKIPLMIGTMIEFPRACALADEISKYADFFSFGTNDLTQTVMGISRDDSGKFLPDYIPLFLPHNPFSTIDKHGVGEFVKMAVEKGRETKPKLKLGVCGEHGGDPESIRFFHSVGLNYVSASPYRVAGARLAGAHAVLEEGPAGKQAKKQVKKRAEKGKKAKTKKQAKKQRSKKTKVKEKKKSEKNLKAKKRKVKVSSKEKKQPKKGKKKGKARHSRRK